MARYGGQDEVRGGVRGGSGLFNWNDVKADKDKEHYLGNSVRANVGRWQNHKDVIWFVKDKQSEAKAVDFDELADIKQKEAEAMAEALGAHVVRRPDASISNEELKKVIKRDLEASSAEAIVGIGYGKKRPGTGYHPNTNEFDLGPAREIPIDKEEERRLKKERKRAKKSKVREPQARDESPQPTTNDHELSRSKSHDREPPREASRRDDREPSRHERESSRRDHREPSRRDDREPSRRDNRESSRRDDREPSRRDDREPSTRRDEREPSRRDDREPSRHSREPKRDDREFSRRDDRDNREPSQRNEDSSRRYHDSKRDDKPQESRTQSRRRSPSL